jgi:uncharacterized protein YggE
MTNKVTTVSARGCVVTDFDTATFTLAFNEFAPKAKDAKLKLKKGAAKITAALDELKKKGLEFLTNNYRSNISVQPNYVYDRNSSQNRMEGQKATYSVTFQTPTLEMVSEAYDMLSELDVNEYTVNSPTYSVRAESAFKQQALEDAWRVAQILFANQCKTLGFDADKFSVDSWQVNYSGRDHGGFSKGGSYSNSVMSSNGSEDDDTIELNAGRAIIDVILTVDYVRTGS